MLQTLITPLRFDQHATMYLVYIAALLMCFGSEPLLCTGSCVYVKLLIPGAIVAMSAVPFQEVVPEVPVLLGRSITAAPVCLQELQTC